MSVGGRGLVAYRLDQLVMFIHVCKMQYCMWVESTYFNNEMHTSTLNIQNFATASFNEVCVTTCVILKF